MQKFGWCEGLGFTQGHQHSHSIERIRLFDFNRNYASILYHFRVIARFSSKVADFNPPHLHLSPQQRVIQFEFRRDLWHQKTRVRHYLRDPMLSRFGSIQECDRHTHRQTHDVDGIYRASIASRGKKPSSRQATSLQLLAVSFVATL